MSLERPSSLNANGGSSSIQFTTHAQRSKPNSPQPMHRTNGSQRSRHHRGEKGENGERESHRSSKDKGPKTHQNLFVACLPKLLTTADLYEIFEPHGCVNASVMMEAATGKSKGFGFVSFPSEDQGHLAIEALNNVPITVRDMSFSMHLSPSRHEGVEESRFVYFRNVPTVLGQDTIRQVFAHYGHLLQVTLKSDPEKEKDFSLVMAEYATIEDARGAIKACNGDVLFPQISTTPVMAKFADPGAVRTATNAGNGHRRQPLPKTLPIAIRRSSGLDPSQDVDHGHSYGNSMDYTGSSYQSEPSSFSRNGTYESSSLPRTQSMPRHHSHEPSSLMNEDLVTHELSDPSNGGLLLGSVPIPVATGIAVPYAANSQAGQGQAGSSIRSDGCSLSEIPNGKLYRHEPYSRNGYVVTPN